MKKPLELILRCNTLVTRIKYATSCIVTQCLVDLEHIIFFSMFVVGFHNSDKFITFPETDFSALL